MANHSLLQICSFISAISLLILGIILVSVYPHEKSLANTHGYLETGGNCEIVCNQTGSKRSCYNSGLVNITFYLPSNSDSSAWTLIPAPDICDAEDGLSCCQNYIQDHALLRIKVTYTNGEAVIGYVGPNANVDSYLGFGITLIILGSILIGSFFLTPCVRACTRTNYESV